MVVDSAMTTYVISPPKTKGCLACLGWLGWLRLAHFGERRTNGKKCLFFSSWLAMAYLTQCCWSEGHRWCDQVADNATVSVMAVSVVKFQGFELKQSDWCKLPSDCVPIGSVTIAGDLWRITIWNLWSNESKYDWCFSLNCKIRLSKVVKSQNVFSKMNPSSLTFQHQLKSWEIWFIFVLKNLLTTPSNVLPVYLK